MHLLFRTLGNLHLQHSRKREYWKAGEGEVANASSWSDACLGKQACIDTSGSFQLVSAWIVCCFESKGLGLRCSYAMILIWSLIDLSCSWPAWLCNFRIFISLLPEKRKHCMWRAWKLPGRIHICWRFQWIHDDHLILAHSTTMNPIWGFPSRLALYFVDVFNVLW